MPTVLDRPLWKGKGKYICGIYGICLEDGAPEGSFKYMIADDYVPSKELPENSAYDIAGMYNKG